MELYNKNTLYAKLHNNVPRKTAQLLQRAIIARTGVTRQKVYRLLIGQTPNLVILKEIAWLTGTTIDDLLKPSFQFPAFSISEKKVLGWEAKRKHNLKTTEVKNVTKN